MSAKSRALGNPERHTCPEDMAVRHSPSQHTRHNLAKLLSGHLVAGHFRAQLA